MPEFDATTVYIPTPTLPAEFYRVGSDGSVWGCQKPGMGAGRAGLWRQLKPVAIGRGYVGVRLGVNGVHRTHYIHRLVLEAFAGFAPDGMECRHLNGDKTDNRACNLCWGTPQENADDNLRLGKRIMGSRIPWSKLREADILAIRVRLGAGERVSDVARDYRVNSETIRSVRDGKTWRHVP